MRLLSPRAELTAIRTVCSRNKKAGVKLLASLSDEYFGYPPAKEAFIRISNLARQKCESSMSWAELCSDPSIDESTRKILSQYKKPPIKTEREVNGIISSLDKYRKVRSMYGLAEDILKTIRAPKVDVEKLLEESNNKITKARTNVNTEECFTHIGLNGNSDKIVREVLSGSKQSYIPTGFKAFDDRNVGVPIGEVTMIGANTSGGKTAVGLQMCINMARIGARVCNVSLEMSKHAIMQRRLANISNTSMGKMIKPKSLSPREKQHIAACYREYKSLLKRRKGFETFLNPDEDISIEELLFTLKPYDYDVIFIDYIGLLKGVDGDDQWKQLGAAARFAKRFASINNIAIVILAQLSEEGIIRYSKQLKEHAALFFSWVRDNNSRESHVLDISLQKSRNQAEFNFQLIEDFETMIVRDLDSSEKTLLNKHQQQQQQTEKDRFGNRNTYRNKNNANKASTEKKSIDIDEDYFKS